ncbi:ATP-dependent Clp protease proteolytic subunit [Alicyclobacillus acidoterrestris]|uniref:ATP-dependent Clp protease proteolytic subunit n=1 Tax=Alicyclobacillus acidoterrestris (strain ATCC 49025 / DSM 3922 / CIP 106132 / NCIMB 13137 / GD3B) TaxID=1356854 RepID=T0BU92_ALIAG|nr:ATP-dependent Clp protease proteolytic subunit [Alicyclobacillus acidoterrestris]EPZ47653.1 hypothetical protein N007_05190 [Alicyclobacillus acidoterrestris ATCC 49025]UNO48028.1 ATP-dependent Clp protease proteolytic subunit [Alicyclobacillus acidoterrestris]
MNRRLLLFDEINSGTVSKLIEKINEINNHDDEQVLKVVGHQRLPITLAINSPGGNVTDGFALVGAIESSETPIHTVAMGLVASMSLLIFLSGHKRFVHNLAIFMYHDMNGCTWGTLTERMRRQKEDTRWMKMYDDYVISKTKIRQEQLDQIKGTVNEWYIYADEALSLGLAESELVRC